MKQNITTTLKRIPIGRILLFFVVVLVLLAAGFVLRSFVPTGWLQSIRIGSFGLPARIVQSAGPSPTALVEVVGGLNNSSTPAVTVFPSSTPTATFTAKPVETGPGVVTVLTLTPTTEVLATEPEPTAAEPLAVTATPALNASNTTSEQPISIPDALRGLNRLISVSRVLLLTFGEGQTAEEERALLEAQLRVVNLRMEMLETYLSRDEAAGEMFGESRPISSVQAAELLATMREAVELIRVEVADPKMDGARLIRAEGQLGMIQEMVQQLRVMAGPVQDETSIDQTPTPAPTSTPTLLPTPTTQAGASIEQMLALMEEMLRQMHEMMPPASTNP